MAKISGEEKIIEIPTKVLRMYRAVIQLIEEGENPESLRVSTITERAGIGKGTAYEYFDSREEIVVFAVVYQLQLIMQTLKQGLLERESFREQLNFLLDIGEQSESRNCFLKLLHLLTDNLELSLQVRSKLESEAFRQYRPVPFFRKVLGAAVERGELRNDLPLDYMVLSFGSRILAYMLAVSGCGVQMEASQMRELVYNGMLEELCAGCNNFVDKE